MALLSAVASEYSVTHTETAFINGTCQLSPFDSHLSTVLSGVIGCIVIGLSGGPFVAFYAVWIALFASLRILVVALWQVCEVVRLRPIVGGEQFLEFWEKVPIFQYLFSCTSARGFDNEPQLGRVDDDDRGGITFLGWFGWLWSTCYAPTIEILWLIENWDPPSGGLMFVRGLSVGAVAIPLTMDVKGRYGKALSDLLGAWAQHLFSLLATVSLLVLGILSVMELILGIVHSAIGDWFLPYYIIMLFCWTHNTFGIDTPNDRGFSTKGFGLLLAGFAVGCFGGLCLGLPSLIMMSNSSHSPGLPIRDYVRCRSVSLWKRVVAVVP